MKTFLNCIPCIVRQTLDSVRLVTQDEAIHQQVLRQVLRNVAEMDMTQTPPAMGQSIHRLIREVTGQSDPYHQIKDRFNQLALTLYPTLREWVDQADNPLAAAVKLAIAGNVIDSAVNTQLSETEVREAVIHALSASLDGNVSEFFRAVAAAERILYLTDNAGEIVFDRLLIERMPREKLTVAVRGFPVINDATMEDAQLAGLASLVKVIDNGSDAPGTILADCSKAFLNHFDQADIVVAKGQGNYETLNDSSKNIYFLLKAKCPVIAEDLGCPMGSLVLRRSALSVSPG
jgi:damage-control phosphatase, subfamily I